MSVRVEEPIAAPIDSVWALVGNFGELARWHPALQRCDVEQVDGSTVRTAHFADLWIKEKLERCDPVAHRLDYRVLDSSDATAIGTRVTIELAPDGLSTRFCWSADVAHPAAARLADYYRLRIGHARAALMNRPH